MISVRQRVKDLYDLFQKECPDSKEITFDFFEHSFIHSNELFRLVASISDDTWKRFLKEYGVDVFTRKEEPEFKVVRINSIEDLFKEFGIPTPESRIETLEKQKQQTIKFDWSCLPRWINNWVAMDSDGSWFCYNVKPIPNDQDFGASFQPDAEGLMIPKDLQPKGFFGDWRESLIPNPNKK